MEGQAAAQAAGGGGHGGGGGGGTPYQEKDRYDPEAAQYAQVGRR